MSLFVAGAQDEEKLLQPLTHSRVIFITTLYNTVYRIKLHGHTDDLLTRAS